MLLLEQVSTICIASDTVMTGCDFGGPITVIEPMTCWVVSLFRTHGKSACDTEKTNLASGLKLALKQCLVRLALAVDRKGLNLSSGSVLLLLSESSTRLGRNWVFFF